MAEIKNFSLTGVGTKVQFGKGGAKLVQAGEVFAFKKNNETDLANVSVGTATDVYHATNKEYVDGRLSTVQTAIDNLSSSRLVDNKLVTTAMVATDEVSGEVTIDAKGTADLASRVATFKSGTAANTSLLITTENANIALVQVISTQANADLHLEAKGDGHVVIGEAGVDSQIVADDDANLSLAGGASAAGVGGDLIVRGGVGATGTGKVIIETGTGASLAQFNDTMEATSYVKFGNGTTNFNIAADGSETNVNLVLSPKGSGSVDVNNAVISHVADGVSTLDAINFGQLASTHTSVNSYTDTQITANKIGSYQSMVASTTTATGNVGTAIKGRIRSITVNILTPYSAGSTITIGTTETPDLLVSAVQIDEATAGMSFLEVDESFGSATQIIATIGGSPAAGMARVIVEFIQG